jgi:hypothetical protein
VNNDEKSKFNINYLKKKKNTFILTNRIVSHEFRKTIHVFDELKIKLKVATNVVATILGKHC